MDYSDDYVEMDNDDLTIGSTIFDNSNQKQIYFLNLISKSRTDNRLTDKGVDSILQILKYYEMNRNELTIPTSVYKVKKDSNLDLEAKYGFTTTCCKKEMFINKRDFDKKCHHCFCKIDMREVILSNNYFFSYSLVKQVKFLINRHGLEEEKFSVGSVNSFYDSSNYKNFRNLHKNELIGCLGAFSDGVRLSKSTDIWPQFLQLKNLNCDFEKKIFLNSCFKTYSKPKLDFFLRNFIDEINCLREGIYIERYKRKVYFYLSSYLLDAIAKAYFLCHVTPKAYFSCTECLTKGEGVVVGKGHSVVYPFKENLEKRSIELNEYIFNNYDIDVKRKKTAFGIKDRTELSKINCFDTVNDVTFEPMHAFMIGTLKYNLLTCLDSSLNEYSSFIDEAKLDLINKRIKVFNFNSTFKRKPEALDKVDSWKANQIFDFLFYILPVVFQSIIDENVYHHFMQLNYILGKAWHGFPLDSVDSLNNIINDYLKKMKRYYHPRNQTPNCHQLNHLTKVVLKHGPLKDLNAFIFESKNGEVKRLVNSFYGVLEQIEDRFSLQFKYDLESECSSGVEFIGKSIFSNGKNYFKKLKIKKQIYTSFDENNNSLNQNCYVQTNDDKFYCILNYFEENSNKFFEGKEIVKISHFELEEANVNFDHLIHAQKTHNLHTQNVLNIKRKIIFIPNFVNNSSEFELSNLGNIIINLFTVHN